MHAFSRAFKVYELDDYLPNLPIKSIHRKDMPKDVMRSLRRGLGYVDRFVVSTEALADAFAGLHSDIRVVENRLPVDWWKGLSSRRRRGKKPRVGWAGGVGHSGDLELITDVVKELVKEVEWVFFGMCPDKLRGYVHEVHAGIDIERYPAALAALDLDLALAPLEQNLFNECKSNLRLLEYGACGFPVVCTDIRCYQGDLPVTRVKNRFRDWVEAIRMHIHDLDATAKQGDALKAAVLNNWMLEGGNLELWRKAWLPQ
jgi:glycosyltransferase involved in cell wall biosynthesis